MPFVQAKCTQCGANIQVDNTKEAGICEFCGTAFITEKSINNYNLTNNINVAKATINITGSDIDNLLLRAKQYEEIGDGDKACEYYNRVLDIDATHPIAKEKVFTLNKIYIGKVEITKADLAEIKTELGNGNKITAIKKVRELTGLGLAEAKNFIDNFDQIDLHKPQSLSVNTTSISGNNTQKTGGCYVATCVYGSYDCPQVWTLRRFRDNTLASTWYGRVFILFYYAISPTIVKLFGKTNWFKKMWKNKLDKMVSYLQSNGIECTPYQDRNWR